MNKKEKEENLRQRLIILKNCLEVAKYCMESALNNLESLDEFNDLVHHWGKYSDIFDTDCK